jgi:hypothetical protein
MVFATLVTSLSAPGAMANALPLPSATSKALSVDIRSGDAAGTHLTLTSKTIEVPASAVKTVSATGTSYTFSDIKALAGLAPGKVVLIEGQNAIVVTSIKHSGNLIVVGATPASIGDVVESGQIEVKGSPNMAQAVGVSGVADSGLVPALVPAASGTRRGDALPSYSYKGKSGSFTYAIAFAGAPNGVHLTGSICWGCTTALNINAKLDGTFTWADQDLDLGMAGGKATSGSFSISGMSSDLYLTYTVLRGEEPGVGAKPPVFRLPVSFEAPLCICGGIPIYSKFEVALLITLGIGAKNSSVEGGAHVTITGSGAVTGTGVGGPGGSWSGHLKGNFITGSALTPAAAGILVALQAKFGVGLGVKDVNGLYYISAIFSVGETTGAAIAGLSCMAFDGSFSVTGNFEVQLLGLKITAPATTLWNKTASYKQPPC